MSLNLFPWRREIERLRQEMDRLYDRFFDWRPSRHLSELGDWWPVVDVSETTKEIIVHAEIPGMEAKDIDVSLEDTVLFIRGERKRERSEEGQEFYRSERSYGSFSRSIRLPVEVDTDRVKATCHEGVLEVVLPKTEKAVPKKIQVEAG